MALLSFKWHVSNVLRTLSKLDVVAHRNSASYPLQSRCLQNTKDLAGFVGYFSRSPKRTSMLDRVVAHRHPRASAVRWNLHIHAMNTVFEHKGDIIQCFETIGGRLSLPLCRKLEGLWGCWRMIPSASSWNYFIASCLLWIFSSASSRSGPSTQSLSRESCSRSHSFSDFSIR